MYVTRIAVVAAFIATLGSTSNAMADLRHLYPATRCGPDLAYFCPIHGYFDQAPFRYSLAIYPGCIKVLPVQTPNGVERRRVLVCGAPERAMVFW